jgi:hypothetical protein
MELTMKQSSHQAVVFTAEAVFCTAGFLGSLAQGLKELSFCNSSTKILIST